jgi:hypothetical protein
VVFRSTVGGEKCLEDERGGLPGAVPVGGGMFHHPNSIYFAFFTWPSRKPMQYRVKQDKMLHS